MRRNRQTFIITDCGSTATKAILIEKDGDCFRQTFRAEAPTTVEPPLDDITIGVNDALEQLALESGRSLLDEGGRLIRPAAGGQGVDVYLSTCSAGGGLQLLVAGLVQRMSVQTARRAALGAGAIVTDAVSCDRERSLTEQLRRLRETCPDIVLLVGGVEGGATGPVRELAERLAAAEPGARLSESEKRSESGRIPLIFAGNSRVAGDVVRILEGTFACHRVGNLRPTLDEEAILPVRDKIQEIFLDHVMTRAPGFRKLTSWVDAPIKPTPRAVGDMLQDLASRESSSILLVDLGGATTDIFTVVAGIFERTVSANLGVSYSAAQVLQECGVDSIARWVPFEIDASALWNAVLGKTVRPGTIPESLPELWIEQALAREALRLAAQYHFDQEWSLKGTHGAAAGRSFLGPGTKGQKKSIADIDLIIASGGVLSSAPAKWQTAAMIVDAFLPEGVTVLAKDSIFMIPQLGLLLPHARDVAREVFERDCLQYLGTCVAPRGPTRQGRTCLEYEIDLGNGRGGAKRGKLHVGELLRLPTPEGGKVSAVLRPTRGYDVGAGKGKPWKGPLQGGGVGIILDGRGRPLQLAQAARDRLKQMKSWLEVYQSQTEPGSQT